MYVFLIKSPTLLYEFKYQTVHKAFVLNIRVEYVGVAESKDKSSRIRKLWIFSSRRYSTQTILCIFVSYFIFFRPFLLIAEKSLTFFSFITNGCNFGYSNVQ